jgi:hypothetical protein
MTGMPELVPCLTAPLADAKEILAACEDAAIPAQLSAEDCCDTRGGCAPKVQLLVAAHDVPRLAQLLESRWQAMVAREGTGTPGLPSIAVPDGEPPCPACGTAGPLVSGACSDCGLQLE